MMTPGRGMAARAVALVVALSLVLSAFFCAFPWSLAAAQSGSAAEVRAFVKAYVDAANKADVTAVMSMFSRKPEVTSIGDGEISRGWDAIKEQYDQMAGKEGTFKISLGTVDVVPLGATYALVVAPYTLTVTGGDQGSAQVPSAMTLVLQKAGGKWLIVQEHDSSKGIEPSQVDGDDIGD